MTALRTNPLTVAPVDSRGAASMAEAAAAGSADGGTESGLKGAGIRRSARRDSQVRPTAQRSGRCPVEVRRFKSCSLHSVFHELSVQEGQL